ncbi:MAG: hypothetical protein AAF597_02740 [Bacteroidota bacterium]
MKEHNYQTLRDALDRLPEYGADAGAWEGIARAMEPELADQLPSYRPPAEVWNGLSQQLDTAAQPAAIPVRRLWPRIAAVAATLLLLVSIGFGISSIDHGPTVSYAYGEEPAPAPIVEDWGEDEESFARVAAQIEARNEPHLNTLHHELTELTAATEEIKAMLVAYGDDPKVVRQLAEIERDRSDIYRQIIVEL